MIKTNTVLVLGAGASQPYAFPTGCDLVERMRQYAGAPGPEYFRTLPSPVNGDSALEVLAQELQIAQPNSIDEFLEHRPDIAEAGKTIIAILLLNAEHNSVGHLWGNGKNGGWYNLLKSRLVNQVNSLGEDRIKIITFNYDRSLEHYLYTSLRPYYQGLHEVDYGRRINQIKFLHIYGSLGPLPWQPDRTQAIPYGVPSPSPDQLRRAKSNIAILHEGGNAQVAHNLEAAKDWLHEAERVLFLGFGFHHTNVERLALRDVLRVEQDIRATCMGLEATSRDNVEYCTAWARRSGRSPGDVTIRFPNAAADCYQFLHDHAVLS